MFGFGRDVAPRREDYPDTPVGFHRWAQDMRSWNDSQGITSGDLVKQWNEERNTRG